MALALYQDNFWYPNGSLAIAVPARIFARHTTTLAPIFADAAGTIPLPNPVTTDGGGILTFYATIGDYWIYIAGSSFRIAMDADGVTDQIWAETYKHDQAVPAAVWNVTHDIGLFPSVDVIDSANTVVYADVQHVSVNQLTITFQAPTTGTAFLRR